MQAAVPVFWDSKLEAPASSLGLTLALSKAPFINGQVTNDEGLQLVASILNESLQPGQADPFATSCELGLDQVPFDESVFDLIGIPELEDVDQLDKVDTCDPAVPPCHPLFDEIPALEDVLDGETNWPSWTSDSASDSIPAALPCIKLEQNNASEVSQVAPVKIVTDDDALPLATYEEEVRTSSPSISHTGYTDICASPSSVYSAGYVSGFGGSSPCSSGFVSSDDVALLSPLVDKKRRVSQVSVSSFCSSIGSPTSSTSGAASDSDHAEQKRPIRSNTGGRRSRFSPEDRKERKKAQNRTAAERYRQKRRQAEETISEEEQQLMDANGVLRIEVTKLEAEVSCLKRLMREMLQAKGIKIPAPPPKKKPKTS